jgi:hypothetical protein
MLKEHMRTPEDLSLGGRVRNTSRILRLQHRLRSSSFAYTPAQSFPQPMILHILYLTHTYSAPFSRPNIRLKEPTPNPIQHDDTSDQHATQLEYGDFIPALCHARQP